MKKTFTKIKKMSLGICALVLFASSMQAATTYTASISGNWSNAATWGGVGSPGNTVGIGDNVIIPLGVTVTMDMDVAVNGAAISYINVMGTLTSTTNSLTITSGALQGTGIMNMMYVEIGSLGSMMFSGTITAANFVNSGAIITVASNIIINDSLILNSGSLAFNVGSALTMNASSNIKVSAGSMSVNTGVLSATNLYNVVYTGASKTSGIETGISTGANNVWVNLTDSTQTVTMGSDVTVTGILHHTMGKLAIGAHTLKLMGDYVATTNGKLQASSTSRLMLEATSAISSAFTLASATQFQYLQVNVGTLVSANFTGGFTVDTLDLKNGTAGFVNTSTLTVAPSGVLIIENGTFAFGTASFNGTNSYSVIYKGINKVSAFEILGAGLHNVMLDLTSAANTVSINSNMTIAGALNMNNGSLNLNSHKLYLTGTYTSTANGTFQGNTASSIFINNTTVAFGDTLNFMAAQSTLDTLSINTMLSSWVALGTGLTVENLTMISGGVMLTNGDLTVNSNGTIMGYDSTKYISTGGAGSLVMNVNAAAPYVLFPVGTNSSYSPASLQIASGTAGMFHVNVQNGMLANGTSGINLALTQSVVNRTWYVVEPAQTGALSANMQVEWKASEEMNSFDRTHAFISHYTTSLWDANTIGAATTVAGSYHQMIRTNLASFSPFAVVDQNAVTGIDKIAVNNITLSIYPNPAVNFAVIDFKNTDAKSVEVYNEMGSKVYSADIADKNTLHKIDIAALPAGIYYVKVATTSSPIFKKLIKS